MRIQRATILFTQRDLEDVAKEWLPAGFALEHIHLYSGGALASLKTPYARLDLRLKQEPDPAPGVLVFSCVVSKGLPIPNRLIQAILEKLALDLPPGIAFREGQLVVAVNDLWASFAHVSAVTCELLDGEVNITAEHLRVSTRPPVKTLDAKDGIA